jgi:hypothetical protein
MSHAHRLSKPPSFISDMETSALLSAVVIQPGAWLVTDAQLSCYYFDVAVIILGELEGKAGVVALASPPAST